MTGIRMMQWVCDGDGCTLKQTEIVDERDESKLPPGWARRVTETFEVGGSVSKRQELCPACTKDVTPVSVTNVVNAARDVKHAFDVLAHNKVVTLCGSTRFKEEFERHNKRLTLDGYVVLSVGFFGHADGVKITKAEKEGLDALHKLKIELSDAIFVINVNGYVGDSTRSEIDFARRIGRAVDWLEPPVPTAVEGDKRRLSGRVERPHDAGVTTAERARDMSRDVLRTALDRAAQDRAHQSVIVEDVDR